MSDFVFTVLVCTALTVTDGDTVRCDGQLLRMLGDGLPNQSGIDTPEIRRARCAAERELVWPPKRGWKR